jgi:hypothetical protein
MLSATELVDLIDSLTKEYNIYTRLKNCSIWDDHENTNYYMFCIDRNREDVDMYKTMLYEDYPDVYRIKFTQ